MHFSANYEHQIKEENMNTRFIKIEIKKIKNLSKQKQILENLPIFLFIA